MNQQEKSILVERLYNVLSCMRNQNSGADIHTVNNIRHTASMLIEELAEENSKLLIDFECARRMVENTEKQVTAFYQDKYTENKKPDF